MRAQVKFGALSPKGYISFATSSVRRNAAGWVRSGYLGQADVFLVWSPDIPDNFYAISVEKASSGNMNLRVVRPKNNQANYHWHEDYLIDRWLSNVLQ